MTASRISEWELWACAQHYVREFEGDAVFQAALRADELLEAGDVEGAHTFTAILQRIEQLLAVPKGLLN